MGVDSQSNSNIRVQIQWRNQTVFAGEDVKCVITFKNVAQDAEPPKTERQKFKPSLASPRARGGTGSLNASTPPISNRGHRRSALSLSLPSTTTSSHNRSVPVQWPPSAGSEGGRPGHRHQRSLSIVSIGSTGGPDDSLQRLESVTKSAAPPRAHNRAASLQISSQGIYSPRQVTSPLYNSSSPPDALGRHSSLPSTYPQNRRRSPRASPNTIPEFNFPASPSNPTNGNNGKASPPTNPLSNLQPSDGLGLAIRNSPVSTSQGRQTPVARILSSSGMPGGTPRSSGEFYAVSNNSTETLASEYVAQPHAARMNRAHFRRTTGPAVKSKTPESLMMGYAQVQGSFTLDGSLVSVGQFEPVKKKAAVGGKGGGVIGLETSKKDTGLLRGFGWGSISNSIGDLLGNNELSSIKELRGAANAKSVPLLSTPHSILFVDLQLAPGESRSYEYTFRLPRGLPPTHKGKLMKISYSLVIGTQRAGGAKEQQVRSVEVPFRVLGSVNSRGEILGHDLMSPYILLRDEAIVTTIGKGHKYKRSEIEKIKPSTMNDFLGYVNELVAQQKEDRGGNLLSPSSIPGTRRPSAFEEVTSAKDAIHFAVLRSNIAAEGQSQNRFEIARNGQRVGVVMLPRPAYRLGEVVTMVIDFAKAEIPCFAVHATLETSEMVDPSMALRSESSIQRVTRRVYAASSEVTMYSRRVVFTPTIPINATPEFVTSSVNFEWKIRVEFVVPAQEGTDPEAAKPSYPLLEQLSQDEKGGLVLVAVENLACESFDVSVPIRVYGAVGRGLERLERDEAAEEGLPV